MKVSVILALAVALVALQLAAGHPLAKRSCACSLRGTDVCSSCIPAAIPRPVRPRQHGVGVQRVVVSKYAPAEFKSKDVCTCEGGLVVAPEIPSVPCKVHGGGYGPTHQAPNYAYEQSNSYGLGGGDDCGDVVVNPCEEGFAPTPVKTYVIPAEESLPAEELVQEVPIPTNHAPAAADAVSLALAYEMATRNQPVPEEHLSFGPMQPAKEGRIIKTKRVVPEGGLYALRNQIVELRTPSNFGGSCDDEAEASLLAAQQACGEVEETGYGASLPSLRDLGFAPVGGDCKFVPGSYQPAAPAVQTIEYTVPAVTSVKTAPAYTACDALATIERGRGSHGEDYYAGGAAENVEEVVETDSAPCASASGPEVEYSSGLSYGPAAVAAVGVRHTGRRGCGCGCGY